MVHINRDVGKELGSLKVSKHLHQGGEPGLLIPSHSVVETANQKPMEWKEGRTKALEV